MLSKSPNLIAICQLTQRAIFFPTLCEKKTCGPVTKCSHATDTAVLFFWKNS